MVNFGKKMALCAALVAFVSATMLASPASGITVNVDFNFGSSPTYTGSAAAPDTGTFWNGIAITAGSFTSTTTLMASDGTTSTPITFTLGGVTPYNDPSWPGNIAWPLFRDFAYSGTGGTITFSINNLTPGGKYDLYLYSQNTGAGNEGQQFTIGSEVKTVTNAGNVAAFLEDVNYVKFGDLTATGGTISGSLVRTVIPGNTTFNGFQLVEVIPEPTGALYLGLGMLTLLRRRLRGA